MEVNEEMKLHIPNKISRYFVLLMLHTFYLYVNIMQKSPSSREESDANSDCNNNINRHDSEFSADSSEEKRWFGYDFLHIASSLIENVSHFVANEIAQLERDGEIERDEVDEEIPQEETGSLPLPWEICHESISTSSEEENENEIICVYLTDTDLMQKILNLSSLQSTFLQPFLKDSLCENQNIALTTYSSTFVLDDLRIDLIRRILDIDKNLVSMHDRLTGGGTDWNTIFWKNYFFHCEKIRAEELRLRKQRNSIKSCAPSISTNDCSARENTTLISVNKKDDSSISEASDDDNESLVPVGSDSLEQQDDNSSYVIQSAPNSVDTFTTTRSDDDVVIIDTFQKVLKDNI